MREQGRILTCYIGVKKTIVCYVVLCVGLRSHYRLGYNGQTFFQCVVFNTNALDNAMCYSVIRRMNKIYENVYDLYNVRSFMPRLINFLGIMV